MLLMMVPGGRGTLGDSGEFRRERPSSGVMENIEVLVKLPLRLRLSYGLSARARPLDVLSECPSSASEAELRVRCEANEGFLACLPTV